MEIADKERLIKLIGMLGSAHDGERANAAAFIQKLAEKYKMTITELMASAHGTSSERIIYKEKVVYKDRPPEPPKSKPYIMPDDEGGFTDVDSPLLAMMRRVAGKPALACRVLSDWEMNFVADVSSRYDYDTQLSDKQLTIVQRILTKASRLFP